MMGIHSRTSTAAIIQIMGSETLLGQSRLGKGGMKPRLLDRLTKCTSITQRAISSKRLIPIVTWRPRLAAVDARGRLYIFWTDHKNGTRRLLRTRANMRVRYAQWRGARMEAYSLPVVMMEPSGCGIQRAVSIMQCFEDIGSRSGVWRSVRMAACLHREARMESESGMPTPSVIYAPLRNILELKAWCFIHPSRCSPLIPALPG